MPVGVCVCRPKRFRLDPPLGRPPPRTAQCWTAWQQRLAPCFVLCCAGAPFLPPLPPSNEISVLFTIRGFPTADSQDQISTRPSPQFSTFHVTPWALKVSNAPCLFLGHDIEFEGHGGCGSEKEDQQRINRRRALHGVTRARAEPEEPFFFSQASPSPILKRSSSGWPSSSP